MPRRKNVLGQNEEYVLEAIWALGEEAYGLNVHDWIERVTGRRYSLGAIYTTTARLQEHGYIGSEERVVEKRPRRYFWLLADGSQALREQREIRQRLNDAVKASFRPNPGGAT